jgi:hypothetical protein
MRSQYVSVVFCVALSWFTVTRSHGSLVGGDCGTNLCGLSQAGACQSGFQNGCASPAPDCCECSGFEYDTCEGSSRDVCDLDGDYPICGCSTRTGLPCWCGGHNNCSDDTY